ncbi:MAG: SUMF1/EgtB/PvdO family nonheme iron enzyme [Actinobacteria bacterium]|uniref:Unannotated protein n=1 Tax=freshwater metagenome TaxID=449393 RepID=A0A6J6QA33_9ZZZZ|nr:SUMF1/EgtB/PvdO family nonheme iron enzyme [Actinomycetota bacterium]
MTEIVWRLVPGGPFSMGSDVRAAWPAEPDETPERDLHVAPYRLSRTPVTNAQYLAYVEATGAPAPGCFDGGSIPPGEADVPVTYVTFAEAVAFCAWAGVRLPTEIEWEAAARGGDDRLWPWGDLPPTAAHARFAAGIGRPGPVGRHLAGASVDGVLDLSGNVMEWVAESHAPYDDDTTVRVVRGGAYVDGPNELRTSYRRPQHPGARDHYIGFRVAADATDNPAAGFDWVDLPGGAVRIGRAATTSHGPAAADELPQHAVDVAPFEISETLVTNAQYAVFVEATGTTPPPHWSGQRPPAWLEQHPVTFVDWFDAQAFCTWADGRLPTEAEWEKAARGTDTRRFPWGDAPTTANAHVGLGAKAGTTASVGSHPEGASPYGVSDLAGNVWEWVASAYAPYPYRPDDGREDPTGTPERVLRGGSFASPTLDYARCAMRSRSRPARRQAHIGFRIARGANT